MKHCPACNFTFPDFHRVCDFDGTELVKDPEPRSLVKVKTSPRQLRFRRSLKSPELWAGLLLIFVLSSVFLVAYYDATRHSAPVVKARPSPTSPANAIPAARASNESVQVKTPVPSIRDTTISSNRLARSSPASLRRQATARRSLAQLDQRISNRARLQKSQIARLQKSETVRRRDTHKISDEKEPKLTAMLKTTWRVLKWPFKF